MSINTGAPNIQNSGMYFEFGFILHFDICVLGLVLHWIRHIISLPMPRPKNIRVVKKFSKIVLGLEVESLYRDNPLLGVAISICNFWGLHKQTNKQMSLDYDEKSVMIP